jgi:hypothetical protein
MYKSMMFPEYKMVCENSENVDYFYPVNQNYLSYQCTQIKKTIAQNSLLFLNSVVLIHTLKNIKTKAQNSLLFLNSVVFIHTLKNIKTIAQNSLLFFKIHRTAEHVLVLIFDFLGWHRNSKNGHIPFLCLNSVTVSNLERFEKYRTPYLHPFHP